MIRMFCDRCQKELDNKNMQYVGMSINDYADDNSEMEHWDFCHECALRVRRSMVKNIADYEKYGGEVVNT